MPTQSKSRTTLSEKERNDALLNELCNRVRDRLDGYLDHLGVDLRRWGSRFGGACPVHGGDNTGAFSIWTDGYGEQCNWQCRTHHCQNYFRRSLLGFTRGVLSHNELNWQSPSDEQISGQVAVDTMCKFLGVAFKDIKIDPSQVERRKFARTVEILTPLTARSSVICSREDFLRWHQVPAPYYVWRKRPFSESVLRKFDVGLCTRRASPNFGRTIVPVYDQTGQGIIGVLSRSSFDKCDRCRQCHDPAKGCPQADKPRTRLDSRWLVDPKGFNDKHHLYNLWKSRTLIRKSKCVVIVEGAGDVWRLDEAGIHNTVGLMGSVLGDLQDILLEECSPAHVVIMTDDDPAGNEAATAIERKWSRLAHVHRVKPVGCSEVGDMAFEDVRKNFRALIEGWMKR